MSWSKIIIVSIIIFASTLLLAAISIPQMTTETIYHCTTTDQINTNLRLILKETKIIDLTKNAFFWQYNLTLFTNDNFEIPEGTSVYFSPKKSKNELKFRKAGFSVFSTPKSDSNDTGVSKMMLGKDSDHGIVVFYGETSHNFTCEVK